MWVVVTRKSSVKESCEPVGLSEYNSGNNLANEQFKTNEAHNLSLVWLPLGCMTWGSVTKEFYLYWILMLKNSLSFSILQSKESNQKEPI